LLRGNHFTTRQQARHAVATWIDEYNNDRRHSTNGMLSPVDYELACATRLATEQHGQPHHDGRAA
jgi:putative transposase